MNQRNTRQKYVVLKVIKENKNHPTISEIYKDVQKIDSSIGQATIYRNVKKFLDEKKIFALRTRDGACHYDYVNNHVHLECIKCGQIIDIMDEELLEILSHQFQNNPEFIENYHMMLEGYCKNCRG